MSLKHTTHILKGEDLGFGESYIRQCSRIQKVKDDVFRNVFTNRPDFNPGKAIGKHIPGPCGEDYLGHSAFYLVLGTGDQVFKRTVSAMMSKMKNIIFIVQSPAEAWWRENWKKNPRKKSNGNRVCSDKFLNVFGAVADQFGVEQNIVMLEIESEEAAIEYASFNPFHQNGGFNRL